MRMIISAYRADVNHWHNTKRTSDLLLDIQRSGLSSQLCIGTFGGKREVSVEVIGFKSEDCLTNKAELWRNRYQQTSVFVELDGAGYLLSEQGTEYLGVVTYDVGDMRAGVDHTMYMDGRCMAVQPRVALQQAA